MAVKVWDAMARATVALRLLARDGLSREFRSACSVRCFGFASGRELLADASAIFRSSLAPALAREVTPYCGCFRVGNRLSFAFAMMESAMAFAMYPLDIKRISIAVMMMRYDGIFRRAVHSAPRANSARQYPTVANRSNNSHPRVVPVFVP